MAQREAWIQIRVSEDEGKAIKKLAASENLPVGTFIRKMLLDMCKAAKKGK